MKLHDDGVLVDVPSVAAGATLVDGADFASRELRPESTLKVQVEVLVPDLEVSGSLNVELVAAPASNGLYDTQAYALLTLPLVQNEECRKTFSVDTDGLARIKVSRVTNGSAIDLSFLRVRFGLVRTY